MATTVARISSGILVCWRPRPRLPPPATASPALLASALDSPVQRIPTIARIKRRPSGSSPLCGPTQTTGSSSSSISIRMRNAARGRWPQERRKTRTWCWPISRFVTLFRSNAKTPAWSRAFRGEAGVQYNYEVWRTSAGELLSTRSRMPLPARIFRLGFVDVRVISPSGDVRPACSIATSE
jgi:hypothetical protein